MERLRLACWPCNPTHSSFYIRFDLLLWLESCRILYSRLFSVVSVPPMRPHPGRGTTTAVMLSDLQTRYQSFISGKGNEPAHPPSSSAKATIARAARVGSVCPRQRSIASWSVIMSLTPSDMRMSADHSGPAVTTYQQRHSRSRKIRRTIDEPFDDLWLARHAHSFVVAVTKATSVGEPATPTHLAKRVGDDARACTS